MLTLPASQATPLATIIFLHGLSQTNTSWLPWVRLLAKDLPQVKWILPQAEIGPIAYHKGAEGPRWFDVHALPPGLDEGDLLTAQSSIRRLQAIVEETIAEGMPPHKILLVGFSQGSAMAMLFGLTFNHTLGGIAILAGWLPPKLREEVDTSHTAACPPLFWAHGMADEQIPPHNALETMDWLRSSLRVEDSSLVYREYPGLKHEVSDDVLQDLCSWLAGLLNQS